MSDFSDVISKVLIPFLGIIVTAMGIYLPFKLNRMRLTAEERDKARIAESKSNYDDILKKIETRNEILRSENEDIKDLITDLKNDITLVNQNVESMKTDVESLRQEFKCHAKDSEEKESFIAAIIKATEGESIKVAQGSFSLDDDVRALVLKWGLLIKDLAFLFHKSETRTMNEIKRGELLKEQADYIRKEYKSFANITFPGLKTDRNHKKGRLF